MSEALRDAYATAFFEVRFPLGVAVLSVEGLVAGVREAVLGGPVTIVTAYNPGAERPTEEENERAQHRLALHLQERGWTFFPAVGFSPDRTHQEPSYAVLGLDPQQARELGAAFQQAAVFYWRGAAGELLWCS